MRTKYVWRNNQWVPYYRNSAHRGILIIPDLPDIKSPIDGRVINGRSGLRKHNKEHNVTDMRDFTETWQRAEREREKHFKADFDHEARKRALAEAIDKHSGRRP